MKYKFQVMVALTYVDKDIEVEIDLSDDEVARIKELVAADCEGHEEAEEAEVADEEDYDYEPPQDLLQILEDNDPDLFDKFWDEIFPPVFVECLIDGFENGLEEKHEDDHFRNYRKADFDELYDMYGDAMELDHDTTCICRVPEEFMINN